MFREVQYFHWALVPVILLVAIFVPVLIILLPGKEFGSKDLAAIAITILCMLPILLLRLITRVQDGVLSVRLFPFPTRHIPIEEIESAEVRTYRPLIEYGGWGIRWGMSGKAYNAQGNRGVQLVLRGGSRVLIGSQRPEDLLKAIQAGVENPQDLEPVQSSP